MIVKQDILGLTLPQLQAFCGEFGFPKFTAKQVAEWLYHKRVDSIDAMTNLSLVQRAKLSEVATIGRETPVNCQVSRDGTKKYLFPVGEDKYVETVYIPEDDRATLCISCQVGCKMGCRFCVTGQQGFHGSLSAGEILNQIFSIPEYAELTNIVFMGMGEPMDNLDAVLAVCSILTEPWGVGWSPKRITVSSVGIVQGLRRFLDESKCHLAISLHNPIPQERLHIMPVQKAFPLNEVLALLKKYDWSGQRRLSFEYTMFRGLNDDLMHAERLVEILNGLDCRVNLIRFHSSPGASFETSPTLKINAFRDYLTRNGIIATLRVSRGEDIEAACGLLAGKAGKKI